MVGAGVVFTEAGFERLADLAFGEVGDGGVELGLVIERAAVGGGGGEELLEGLDLLQAEVDGVEMADELGLVISLRCLGGLSIQANRDKPRGGEGLGDLGERLGRGAGEARGARVEVGLAVAAALRIPGVHAEAEHEQAVVGLAAVADELAEAHHRDELALDRAFKGEVAEALDAEVERGFPGARLGGLSIQTNRDKQDSAPA